jgi:branched-chain amino acid aminotransferase
VSTGWVWLNGSLVEEAAATVSVRDVGLLHGAGVFTTMRAVGGRVFRLDAHLQRLAASCQALALPLPYAADVLREAVTALLARMELADARLRLTVTRGSPGEDGAMRPTVLLTATPFEPYPAKLYERGMTVMVLDDQKLNPFDVQAGHKTLNYFSRLTALRRAAQRQAGEALWFNVQNHLQSGSISNVFLVRDGRLRTPPTAAEQADPATDLPPGLPPSAVLPGITRAAVLDLARAAGLDARPAVLDINDLLAAQEVFLTNSIMGLLPVCRIEKHDVGHGNPGPVWRELSGQYEKLLRAQA